MKKGTVEWFNAQKRFGFIKYEEGAEAKKIWFHYNAGHPITVKNGQPAFAESTTVTQGGKTYRLSDPKNDESVIFDIGENAHGATADPWGYLSDWNKAEEWIKAHPAPPPTTYKALETMNNLGELPGEPKVLWEGTDLTDLLRRYPVPTGRQSPGSDPLIPYFGDSDNIFETRHWFERKLADGTWEKCPDPRPLGGTNRQFERISNRW